MKRTVVAAALLAAIGAGAWFYLWGPCGTKRVAAATGAIQSVASRWDDANALAGRTSRIALAGPVAELQSLRREVESTPVPACLALAKIHLTSAMDYTIQGYLEFMSDQSGRGALGAADSKMGDFVAELARVTACSPFCR